MAHGTPDYGVTAGGLTTYQLTDLAELAVRQGSIVSYDRLGEVFFLDDFETQRHVYEESANGADSGVGYNTVSARSGLQSIYMTAGPLTADLALMRVLSCDLIPSRVGFQISFHPWHHLAYVLLTLIQFDGATLSTFKVRWKVGSKELQVWDASGAFVTVAQGVDLLVSETAFHTIKLVGDCDADRYVRLKLDRNTYDVRGYAAELSADVGAPYISYEWRIGGDGVGPGECWFDDLVLTQNEPA